VHGTDDPERRTAAISMTLTGMTATAAARELSTRHGIVARAGLHCAPLAHRALGTEREGTLRVSFGPFNEPRDVDRLLEAIAELAELPD